MNWKEKLQEKGISFEDKTMLLAELKPDTNNANVHPPEQIEQLKRSLDTFGQPVRLIVTPDGTVVGGNGRLEAMQQLGWQNADVTVIDADKDYISALGLALNKTAESSYLDDDMVKMLMEDMDDEYVEATGFSEEELSAILEVADMAADTDYLELDEEEQEAEKTQTEAEDVKKPTATTDGYSSWEIVMQYENKVRFVNALNDLKTYEGINNIEDAVMHLVTMYEEVVAESE